MKAIVLRRSADRDLDDIYDWIAADDPVAAERHIRRIVAAAERLADFPETGRARPEIGEGARSVTVGRYLLLYRIERECVDIVRIVHGAREVAGLRDGE